MAMLFHRCTNKIYIYVTQYTHRVNATLTIEPLLILLHFFLLIRTSEFKIKILV
jgi:hypothetical protein